MKSEKLLKNALFCRILASKWMICVGLDYNRRTYLPRLLFTNLSTIHILPATISVAEETGTTWTWRVLPLGLVNPALSLAHTEGNLTPRFVTIITL